MINFSDKIFFALLAAIPLLTAIYFLFRKSKPLVVSTLLLWAEQKQSRRSGMTFKKMPLPLTFWLELLIIIALALAAAAPLLLRKNDAYPMTLILDNSFSMQAGKGEAPQVKALKEINRLTSGMAGRKFRIIIAGPEPRNLGEFTNAADIAAALQLWTVNENSDSINQAIAMARRLDRESSTIRVFTDRQPENPVMPENVSWHAFGQPLSNIAIVNAARTFTAGKDRAMVVIANISNAPGNATLQVSFPGTKQPPSVSKLFLESEQLKKISVDLPGATQAVEFALSDDVLDFDNRIILLPESRPLLRTSLQITDKQLAADLKLALESSGKVLLTNDSPVLTVTDNPARIATADRNYRLFIQTAAKGRSSAGPFTVNHNHPLTAGLELHGAIWGVPENAVLPGIALISAGDLPVLSFDGRGDSGGDIHLAYVPGASTVQNTPAWPVLFWDLAEWLGNNRPGPLRANFRSGEKIPVNLPDKNIKLTLKNAAGSVENIPTATGRQLLNINTPGTYELIAGKTPYQFRVNPLNYRESDLRHCGRGTYEGARSPAATQNNYLNIAWIPLLAALLLLLAHQLLTGRRNRNDNH